MGQRCDACRQTFTAGRNDARFCSTACRMRSHRARQRGDGAVAPVVYFGAKSRLASRVIELLPPHSHYVEVFAGSAAVLFAKSRSRLETVNDIDGSVVNFFKVLRDPASAARLAELVALTPFAAAEFDSAKGLEPTGDPTEDARRFLVRSNMATGPGGNGWSRLVDKDGTGTARSQRWAKLPDRLRLAAARFAGVQVDCLDWADLIDRYDHHSAVFYVDPPYIPATRRRSVGTYRTEMPLADHERLAERLARLRGSVVLSHYAHPVYDALGWDVHDVDARADTRHRGPSARVERLYVKR